jgi:NAD(P)-dependent dehydrogenase (short-subunit alcohol dehydrogenase family)
MNLIVFTKDNVGSNISQALVNVSSFMAHSNPAPAQGDYAASKAALASLLQHLSEEFPADKIQIVNLHPGAILTESAKAAGVPENLLPWDKGSFPPSGTLNKNVPC